MKVSALALLALFASPLRAQTTYTVTCAGEVKPKAGDTLVVKKTATGTLCASHLVTAPPVVTPPPVVPPALPPSSLAEPVYTVGQTIVMQDNMDRYASTTAMGAFPFQYAGPMITPMPSPSQQSQPVDTQHAILVTGRGGGGKALELRYDGVYQESHNFATINLPAQPDNATVYVSYYGKVTTPTPWPASQALAVKWLELWHNHADGTRIQFNTRYPSSANTTQTQKTVWQVIDQGEAPNNSDQPLGPYFSQVADGQWHRYTYAVKPHTSSTLKDGFARMWIDGALVIDVEQKTVGVTPPGGVSPWCSQAGVDFLATMDGIHHLVWGGPQTTVTGPWVMDVDDLLWWRQ